MSAAETKDGATLTIFVKPNAPKFKIEIEDSRVIVYSSEEPVKCKVNKEILKELWKLLGLRAEIVSGLTSKQKVLLFRGTTKAQVEERLRRL